MTEINFSHVTDHELTQQFGDIGLLFKQADLDGDGLINSGEAVKFFPRYPVSNDVLRYLWTKSVKNPSIGMTHEDFKTAMKIVYAAMKQPSMSTTVDISSIPDQDYAKYLSHFQRLSGGASTVQGNVAAGFFAKSQLPTPLLKHIWSLVDRKGAGYLEKHEFCVALHIITMKLKNKTWEIPKSLPPSLLQPPQHHITPRQSQSPIMSPALTPTIQSPRGSIQSPRGQVPSGTFTPPPGFGVNMETSQKALAVNKLIQETSQLKQDIFAMKGMTDQGTASLEKLKKQEAELLETINQQRQEIEQLRAKKVSLSSETSTLEAKLKVLAQEKISNQMILDQLKAEVNRLSQLQLQGEEAEKNATAVVQNLEQLINGESDTLAQKKEAILAAKRSIDAKLARKEELEKSAGDAVARQAALQEELRQATMEIDKLTTTIEELERSRQVYEKKIQDITKETQEQVSKSRQLQQKLEMIKQEISSYEKKFVGTSQGSKLKLQALKALEKQTQALISEFNRVMNKKDEEFTVSDLSSNTILPDFGDSQKRSSIGKSLDKPDFAQPTIQVPDKVPPPPPPEQKQEFNDFFNSDDFGVTVPPKQEIPPPPKQEPQKQEPPKQEPKKEETKWEDFEQDFKDTHEDAFKEFQESTTSIGNQSFGSVVVKKGDDLEKAFEMGFQDSKPEPTMDTVKKPEQESKIDDGFSDFGKVDWGDDAFGGDFKPTPEPNKVEEKKETEVKPTPKDAPKDDFGFEDAFGDDGFGEDFKQEEKKEEPKVKLPPIPTIKKEEVKQEEKKPEDLFNDSFPTDFNDKSGDPWADFKPDKKDFDANWDNFPPPDDTNGQMKTQPTDDKKPEVKEDDFGDIEKSFGGFDDGFGEFA